MGRHTLPEWSRLLADDIDGAWLIIRVLLRGIFDVIDDSHAVRRATLALGWYLMYESLMYCFEAGRGSNWNAGTIAASLGILTPISALLIFLHKFYGDHKQQSKVLDIAEKDKAIERAQNAN